MEKCKFCNEDFEPKQWQLRRKDYVCSVCYKARQKEYRKAAKNNGKPYVSGKMPLKYHQQYQQDYKKKDYVKQSAREHQQKLRETSTELPKINARIKLNAELRKGNIVRLPCIVCGNVKSEAHHKDYNKPLEVMWLCRKHHTERHKQKAEQLNQS